MKNFFLILFLFSAFNLQSQDKSFKGFLDFEWIDSSGTIILHVPENFLNKEFLYVGSLASGVGSNDIGLDRGQLGSQKLVYFYRSGNKLLLRQRNLKYRANSTNQEEVKAVTQAFAESVLAAFKITKKIGSNYQIDLKDFLLLDVHGVAKRLKDKKQGSYSLDKSRSVIHKEGLFNFPKNSELEAILTFAGEPTGSEVNITADPNAITVTTHHSFIELPDNSYQPRIFKPESGYFYLSYDDYASAIGEDMTNRFITRHRLEKKMKNTKSEAIEPIIYYIDRGCPEPIKSALMEGASWWNQAFEYAGYINAFQVKELPLGAHPLDVRYNMIQWVHRSTRGWSYGSSIRDPRTGEILKGHVSLGSLRVRQDYMIAQGIISNFKEGKDDPRMLEMALARLRQLSAHEVGHTIGLAHNFAASINNRASVMDYPHPFIESISNTTVDLSIAYAVGIGDWDKRAILYGYSDIPQGQKEESYLQSLIDKHISEGYHFITDADARPAGGAHYLAHLWDNGSNPTTELNRIILLRDQVLKRMGKNSLGEGRPYSDLEKILVPVYLMHRYQVEGAAKVLGGLDYQYSTKADASTRDFKVITVKEQKRALTALLKTMDKNFLSIPDNIIKAIPPPAYGHSRDRETFTGYTGVQFDPLAAAEASANNTLQFLLHPQRLARINLQAKDDWNLEIYLNELSTDIFSDHDDPISLGTEKLYFIHLLKLSNDHSISKDVKAYVLMELNKLSAKTSISKKSNSSRRAHIYYLNNLKAKYSEDPEKYKLPTLPTLPPGSPIGCH